MATSYSRWIGKGVLEHIITMHGAETSARFSAPGLADKTVHLIEPASGVGRKITIEGNNSTGSDNWSVLHDHAGNELTVSGSTIIVERIADNPRYIHAKATGGATTDSVVVRFLCR